MTKPISCEAHDYFEIVCMRHSKVQLTLVDHQTVLGIAKDIVRKGDRELIVVEAAQGAVEVDLTEVMILEALDNSVDAHNFEMVF
ncbi:Rho-binding antiterminator [Litoribrevibacter euphylliae]|uniref:Rho-binding antiterminator n=1 Tax=Litoribrevibacter euphylliae TaxID=1834034 RepID=A0ABV7HDD4_9GAMM